MTATQPAQPVCPECGKRNTMILSSGLGFCFDDHTEWDPAAVSALPRPQTAPEPVQTAADVLGPPMESGAETEGVTGTVEPRPETAGVPVTPPLAPFGMADELSVFGPPPLDTADPTVPGTDDLVGGTARLEGGQVATVLSFPDADHVVVRTNDGRDETVALGDVEHITPRAPAYVIDPAPEPAVTAGWITDVEALSNIIIQAGVFTIEDVDGSPSVGPPPPAGWLPRDQSSNALVEAAAALAVARLVIAYELDVDDILEGVQAKQQPVEGDQPTEVEP